MILKKSGFFHRIQNLSDLQVFDSVAESYQVMELSFQVWNWTVETEVDLTTFKNQTSNRGCTKDTLSK